MSAFRGAGVGMTGGPAEADTVHVWLIAADLTGAALAGLASVLDDAERQRVDGIGLARHRRRFIAAHGAARVILGQRLGVPAGAIGWRRGRHGKPELTGAAVDTQVNLTHSGDLAMLAVTGRRAVGVDLQRLPSNVDPIRMSARYFPAAEARFVAAADGPAEQLHRFAGLWARKEACLKVAGGRLVPGLRLPVRGPAEVVRDPGGPLPGPYRLRDLPAPPGYHAAVALAGELPFQVVQHRWSLDR
jgi:4'-phosphopantetheinyl transferase